MPSHLCAAVKVVPAARAETVRLVELSLGDG
jgi:hypothetical protein